MPIYLQTPRKSVKFYSNNFYVSIKRIFYAKIERSFFKGSNFSNLNRYLFFHFHSFLCLQ